MKSVNNKHCEAVAQDNRGRAPSNFIPKTFYIHGLKTGVPGTPSTLYCDNQSEKKKNINSKTCVINVI